MNNNLGEKMIKDKYSWIPKLPEAVLIKKPFYQMSDVEKKIYHLGYEKFRLIAELNGISILSPIS